MPPPVLPGEEGLPNPTNPFCNAGARVEGGLPFATVAALRRERAAANSKDNPDAYCLPIGLMQLHHHPELRKIIQTPGVVTILYEATRGNSSDFYGWPRTA